MRSTRERPLIARSLMAFPPFARLVRALAGVEPAPPRPLAERIAARAEELRRDGYTAISALAAAEATELVHEHRGLRFDRVEYDQDVLLWTAVYETGPVRAPTMVRLPLEHATEATQRGVSILN